MTRTGRLIIGGAALGAAFVTGLAVPRPLGEPGSVLGRSGLTGLQPRTVSARGELAQLEEATIALFQATSPSVVQVVARSGFSGVRSGVGSGTGWVWDNDRHIVTNDHVVAGADAVAVRLNSGELVDAQVIGRAPQYDLAVLQLSKPIAAPPLALGASDELRVGQAVFAIGNPFGLEGSLTSGIVSALNRNLPTQVGREILGLVQTDAAINPGNSGGPLLDSAGRVVGVNTAIVSPSGAYAGVGFAIPVDTVRRVAPLLITQGRAPTPGIGVALASAEQAASLGVEGLLIAGVTPNGPAERAGLRGTDLQGGVLGDVIVAVNGDAVRQVSELVEALERAGVGETVELGVRRGEGGVRSVRVRVGDIGQ